jgi:hypothetical protein
MSNDEHVLIDLLELCSYAENAEAKGHAVRESLRQRQSKKDDLYKKPD